MECNGIVLARMGSIAGLVTHLNLLIFNISLIDGKVPGAHLGRLSRFDTNS